MLAELSEYLSQFWGPFRLLSSYSVLSITGSLFSLLATFFLLPRTWDLLTKDKGRLHSFGAEKSVGKPLGVGVVFILIAVVGVLLFSPFDGKVYLSMGLIVMASIVGYIDDAKPGGLSEITLGVSDLVLSILVCMVIFYENDSEIWLPFINDFFELSYLAKILIFAPVVWLSINALNCNDGVDGLSGSLSIMTISVLGLMLYSIVGNVNNAEYLLIPFYENAANWTIVSLIFCGSITGYLWYNAPPSQVLMGDAGSRPLGMLIGILICVSGNPVLIVFSSAMILINGASGLAKVLIMRVFKIKLLTGTRFPLHDHMRKNLGWSNSQVLIRFLLLHSIITALFFLVLLKIR